MNPHSRLISSLSLRLPYLLLPVALSVSTGCNGGDGVADDDNDDEVTPTLSDTVEITFNLEDGQAVSQVVSLEVSGGAATSMSFVSPPELVGVDLDSDPAILAADWDTTLETNGEVTITVEADGPGGPVTESITVYRNNISAVLKGTYTASRDLLNIDYLEDGDYVRGGSPLLLSFTASPFGSTPTLDRIEIRSVSGAGLAPPLPMKGVQDGDWWDFNLGTPSEGTIDLVVSAINNSGEYSEPLVLQLVVLRTDIVSVFEPYDFEVSPDGKTGILLTGNPADQSNMRVEFLDLTDPINPAPTGQIITLDTGATGDYSKSGNILVSPVANEAYVLFANSYKFYGINLDTRAKSADVTIQALVAPNSGAAIGHVNRSPYAKISPDGKYVFALITGAAGLIVLDTATMSQVESDTGNEGTFVNVNLGLMAVHPNGGYVYFVNNFGDSTAASALITVFDITDPTAPTFVDFNPGAMGTQSLAIQTLKGYSMGQEPMVTPDGRFLVTTWCAPSTGDTKLALHSLPEDDPGRPSFSQDFELYTTSGTAQTWGTPVAVSSDSLYLLVGDQQPGLGGGTVVDLSMGRVVPGISFPNGVADGVFASATTAIALSSSWTDRDAAFVDMTSSSVSDLAIPGFTGLVPPGDVEDLRNTMIVQHGNYVYFVAPAKVANDTGAETTLGTTLSVYDAVSGRFIFPTPLGG